MKDSQRKAIHAKRFPAIGVFSSKVMFADRNIKKPFLVIKIQPNNNRTNTFIPKKSFDDLKEALSYSHNFSMKNDTVFNLHENPEVGNKVATEDDINDFVHGTKDMVV